MADPFEVRLRFTNLLSHLSASTSSSIRCAQYALKHRDMDEDLHSCILEQLERNNMNNRANIMYFLEHFCELSVREGYEEYVAMIRRDIGRIVEAVAPGDGSGAANVKVARRVVGVLGEKGVLGGEVVGEMEGLLREREGVRVGGLLGEDDEEDEEEAEMGESGAVEEEGGNVEVVEGANVADVPKEDLTAREQKMDVDSRHTPRLGSGGGPGGGGGGGAGGGPTGVKQVNGVMRMDKRVIEQRIEEDRERNKRLRESVWAVGKDDDEELDKMWEEGSDVGEDDFVMTVEEAEERRQGVMLSYEVPAW
jgi:CTD kinase subunit gamma